MLTLIILILSYNYIVVYACSYKYFMHRLLKITFICNSHNDQVIDLIQILPFKLNIKMDQINYLKRYFFSHLMFSRCKHMRQDFIISVTWQKAQHWTGLYSNLLTKVEHNFLYTSKLKYLKIYITRERLNLQPTQILAPCYLLISSKKRPKKLTILLWHISL